MIIVEGPRNSGKTTLVTNLSLAFELPEYDYEPDGSKPYDLIKVLADVKQWPRKPTGIYDTHPLIMEYIYGPLLRKRILPEFDNLMLRDPVQFMAANAIIIYCCPSVPLDDPATAYYNLVLNSPLSVLRSWTYDYTTDPDAGALKGGIADKLYNYHLDKYHRKIGSRSRSNGHG
jgi:hypothetical protein